MMAVKQMELNCINILREDVIVTNWSFVICYDYCRELFNKRKTEYLISGSLSLWHGASLGCGWMNGLQCGG